MRNPLERLALPGPPPLVITLGVTLLAAFTQSLVVGVFLATRVLSLRDWPWLFGGWAGAVALTATLTYALGGVVWRPFSWLHQTITRLLTGELEPAQEPPRGETRDLLAAFGLLARELQGYRTLEIDRLILEKNELRAAIDSMSEGLLILDLALRPVLVNPALRRLARSGQKTDPDLADHHLFADRWVDPERVARLDAALLAHPERPGVAVLELREPTRFVKRTSSPLYGADGQQVGHVLVYLDLTGELEADRLKSEFVSNASHELRTPVTSMRLLTETLLDGAHEDLETRLSFLTDLEREAARLHELVNDLLDLSTLESRRGGSLELADIGEVLREAIATVQPQATGADLELRHHLPRRPLLLRVDRVRFGQIFVNLLANAIKFTPRGGRVELMVQLESEAVLFHVSDTGIGIPAADLPHVFDRFFRVSRDRGRRQGGSGLGLSIVRQAVELHGGQIDVRSVEGGGTTFTVMLPRAEGITPELAET
ncbi:MAG: ATP-binding protein [bacterium]|nr:ATP-binding protein [bacterium]